MSYLLLVLQGESSHTGFFVRLTMSREERAEWADETLNRINYILADPTLSDDVRQQVEESLSEVKLMLAGMALSTPPQRRVTNSLTKEKITDTFL